MSQLANDYVKQDQQSGSGERSKTPTESKQHQRKKSSDGSAVTNVTSSKHVVPSHVQCNNPHEGQSDNSKQLCSRHSAVSPTNQPIEIQQLDSSPYKFSRLRQQKPYLKDKSQRSSLHEDMLHSYETESQSVQEARNRLYQSSIKKLKTSIWEGNDKLFADLLDDLDNISKLDTESARKRKKARDMFSDWLFSQDAQSPENTFRVPTTPQQQDDKTQSAPPGGGGAVPKLRSQKSDPTITANRRSTDLSDIDLRTSWLNSRWRPRSFEYQSEEVRLSETGWENFQKCILFIFLFI